MSHEIFAVPKAAPPAYPGIGPQYIRATSRRASLHPTRLLVGTRRKSWTLLKFE
jgi:hypothetical protein